MPSPHHPSSALPCRSDVDLFGVVSPGNNLRVFINEPLGTFTLADETFLSIALQSSYTSTSDGFLTIALGDLDADGDVDFVLGETSHDNGFAKRTFLNNGRGAFTEVDLGYRTKDSYTTALALVDLDGDGDLEVLEANSPINSMYGESRILYACLPPFAPSCCIYLLHLLRALTGTRDAQAMMKFVVCDERDTARSTAYGSGCLQACPSFATRGAPNLDVCIECPIHTVRSTDGGCVGCPPGEDRPLGENACDKCTPGSATLGNSVGCTSCKTGFFAASNGSVSCTICAGGSYQDTVGSASCAPCPAGSYCVQGATEPKACPLNSYCPAESIDFVPCGINLVTGGLGAMSKVCFISHPRIILPISVPSCTSLHLLSLPLLDPQPQ